MKCTCEETMLCNEAICIIDFAGSYKHKGFWADWCPNSNKVYFGGHWFNIPSWPREELPTEEEVDAYISLYDITDGLKINYDEEYDIPAKLKHK